jgi:hypothetical protein
MTRGSANRKAVNHKYSKLEARPLRRSSISAARKSDKGTRRLFLHRRKPEEKKEAKKGTGAEIVSSPEPPPKPPRAHEEARVVQNAPVVDESGKGMKLWHFQYRDLQMEISNGMFIHLLSLVST